MPDTSRQRLDSITSQSSAMPSSWSGGHRPPSPSYSTTTTGSRVDLGEAHTLISRKDLRQSIACFEELMVAAKAYRNALLAMSSATAAFASAMEACSRVKGCHNANSALAGGAGLQFLISNHEQILADAVYRQFEIPLLETLDHYKLITADRLASYEKALYEQSSKIRKTEAENLKIGRRRKRDLQQFREALAVLQRQVNELDKIKIRYHEEVLESEDETWDTVLNKVAFVIRSQLDFYEKIAGKASDPVLEPLVMSIPDPFDAYGPPKDEGQIISVLSPLGMLDASPHSPTPKITRTSRTSSNGSTPRAGSPNKVPFPSTSITSPTKAEASSSTVSAMGTIAETEVSAELENGGGSANGVGSRARRELSVIDERESNAAMSVKGEVEDGGGKRDGKGSSNAGGERESTFGGGDVEVEVGSGNGRVSRDGSGSASVFGDGDQQESGEAAGSLMGSEVRRVEVTA